MSLYLVVVRYLMDAGCRGVKVGLDGRALRSDNGSHDRAIHAASEDDHDTHTIRHPGSASVHRRHHRKSR